ncbi:hypothetical protein TWF694_003269 [Orbilia ellipsospora]|uniref:Uncharacterized protein n=1 Tax=Orbilia ellipsospora TaxID=2528407 RepID=A0AAV9X3L1_9PEZI
MTALLLAGLPMAFGLSSTFTSTVTNVQTSTYTPLVIVSEGAFCNCNITAPYLCIDLISTWNPFGYSSMTSSSIGSSSNTRSGTSTSTSRRTSSKSTTKSRTTTTTTITRSSSSSTTTTSGIPTPSNLYTFLASDIEAIDIGSSGNMVLTTPGGLTASFTLNSDGTLTTYGSNFTLFANFQNIISTRDLNTIYGLGLCMPKGTSSSGLLVESNIGGLELEDSIYPRQGSGITYAQFFLSDDVLQFTVGNTSYGFINCAGSTISIYEALSDDIPSTCGAVDLSAFSVPTASYSQYYFAGLSTKSAYTLSSCGAASSSSSASSTASGSAPVIPSENNYNYLTKTGAEADFTTPSNPHPVFAMALNDGSYVFVGSDLQITPKSGNLTNFHGFQTTPEDGMIFYGTGAVIFANTSVSVDNSKKRTICYSSPVYLQAASPGAVIPDGATTGPFITNPDIGLLLTGYDFMICSGSNILQLLPDGCPIPDICTLADLALYLLDEYAIQQALYNGNIFSQQIFTPTPTSNPPVTTSGVVETDAVDFARDQLMEGLYSDFCSSELGYFTTSAVINDVYSPITTVTAAAYEVSNNINYLSTVLASVTTDLTVYTTTTTTSLTVSTYNIVSRILSWFTATTYSIILTSTVTYSTVFYPKTSFTTLTLQTSFITIKPRTLQRRTQAASLTPPSLQGYDPNIVGSGCSAYFAILQTSSGVTATTFTFFSDTTTVIQNTATSYTSTFTSVFTTTFPVTGTVTSYSYTSTTTDVSTSVTTDTDYIQVSTTVHIQVTDFTTEVVYSYGRATRTSTDGTTTTTVVNGGQMTICSPTNISGGGIPATVGRFDGSYIPFRNFSYPTSYSDPNGFFATLSSMPPTFPTAAITGYAQGLNKSISEPTDYPAYYLSSMYNVCVGCSYYFRVEYRWNYTARYPQKGVTNTIGYKNSQLRVVFQDLQDNFLKKHEFTANAYDNGDIPGSISMSNKGVSVMTNNFTAIKTPVYYRIGLQWLNLDETLVPASRPGGREAEYFLSVYAGDVYILDA